MGASARQGAAASRTIDEMEGEMRIKKEDLDPGFVRQKCVALADKHEGSLFVVDKSRAGRCLCGCGFYDFSVEMMWESGAGDSEGFERKGRGGGEVSRSRTGNCKRGVRGVRGVSQRAPVEMTGFGWGLRRAVERCSIPHPFQRAERVGHPGFAQEVAPAQKVWSLHKKSIRARFSNSRSAPQGISSGIPRALLKRQILTEGTTGYQI